MRCRFATIMHDNSIRRMVLLDAMILIAAKAIGITGGRALVAQQRLPTAWWVASTLCSQVHVLFCPAVKVSPEEPMPGLTSYVGVTVFGGYPGFLPNAAEPQRKWQMGKDQRAPVSSIDRGEVRRQ